MAKIAIIGASSVIFTRQFLNDLLQVKALSGSTFALMAQNLPSLKKVENYANRVIKKNHLDMTVYSTTDRRDALAHADYVIITINVGKHCRNMDISIPEKYGVNQAIGDSLGPGGVFRAQRTIPVILDIAKDMEELCPNALMLNYTNPMAMVCLALGMYSKVNFVGLCHGVQTTLGLIAKFTDTHQEDIDYACAGINHMAWFLKLEAKGKDLYPLLKQRIEQPEYYAADKVRCEVMRHFGYFMTETTEHLSEYLPWFRKRKELMALYLDRESSSRKMPIIENDKMKALIESPIDILEYETGDLEPRSLEYCSYIIEAMETGKSFHFNGNVLNCGWIDNLPQDSCVEVPVCVDENGLHPVKVGRLPSNLAAVNMSNILVQQLSVEAAVTGDPELLFSAVSMDPLTSAVLSLKEIRQLVAELYEAEKDLLIQYTDDIKTKEDIILPQNVIPVEVPIDPAFAVAHKIAKLFG